MIAALVMLSLLTTAKHGVHKTKTKKPVASASPKPAPPRVVQPSEERAAAAVNEALSMMGPRATSTAAQVASAPPPVAETKASAPATQRSPSAAIESAPVQVFDLFVGGGTLTRGQSYNDDLFGQLQAYNLPVSATLGGQVEYYPGGHVRQGLPAAFGVVGSAKGVLGLRTRNGTAFTQTQVYAIEAGVRARLVLGRFDAGLSLTAGMHHFGFSAPPSDTFVASAVSYVGIQPSASLRIALPARLSLYGSFGYSFLLSAGELKSRYFPRTSGGAFDAQLAISYALTSWLDARVMGNLRWYALSFNPRPGDAFVAGGSDDRYFTMMLGLAVRI